MLKNEYLVDSAALGKCLSSVEAPERIKDILDKSLYLNILGEPLFKFLTIEEVLLLDNWISSRKLPVGFSGSLAEKIADEFGIEFLPDNNNEDQNWKNLFRK